MNPRKALLTGAALVSVAVLCMAQSTVIRYLRDLRDGPTDTPANTEVLAWNSTSGRAEWVASAASSGITNGADALLNSLTVTNAQTNLALTASRLLVTDSAKRITNSVLISSGSGNIGIGFSGAPSTNVVDMTVASATNILNGDLTILHATNGVANQDWTHVRTFWAGGADRALVVPAAWKTNVNSPVPASITNGTITVMYVRSLGDTGSSANQSNVVVSFEFYK